MVKRMNQEDITKAIIFSQKVDHVLYLIVIVLTDRVPEPIHVHNHLGRLRHICPRVYCFPLYPPLPHPYIPKNLLLGPRSQSLLLHEYRPCRLPYLPTYFLPMGSHDWWKRILRN